MKNLPRSSPIKKKCVSFGLRRWSAIRRAWRKPTSSPMRFLSSLGVFFWGLFNSLPWKVVIFNRQIIKQNISKWAIFHDYVKITRGWRGLSHVEPELAELFQDSSTCLKVLFFASPKFQIRFPSPEIWRWWCFVVYSSQRVHQLSVKFAVIQPDLDSLKLKVNSGWTSSIETPIYTHMRTMVLVYLPTKLGDFFRANVGKYSSTMEHMG